MSQVSTHTHDATPPRTLAYGVVDNTDWLKTGAIVCVSLGHFGFFFVENDLWWSIFGRFAAPVFFFLVGYAQTRTIPLHWIWIGIILTLLESWNADWTWVAPNILLSLALIRLARPYGQMLLERQGWSGFVLLVIPLFAALPVTTNILDYGAEGWLWALFGLCQRRYLDSMSAVAGVGANQRPSTPKLAAREKTPGLMRLLACLVAVVAYLWQEQKEYSFPAMHLAVVILGLGILCVSLCLFRRGESRIQPPEKVGATMRFIGRHTLEIYAIQLAGSELIVKLVPSLAP